MKRIIIILSAIVAFCLPARAQFEKKINPWPVQVNGQALELPFTGGFNNPRPQLLDYDHNGTIDLFIGEIEGKLLYFKNVGTPESFEWQLASERFGNLDIGSWSTFCDIDNDNDYDIFCDSRLGKVLYYRNDNDSFTLIDSAFGGFVVGNSITPAFCDLDNDGDFDFFNGNVSGYLSFYENIGSPTTPDFVLVTEQYDSVYAFPQSNFKSAENLHGLANITFADIDGDNDYDLFWGDIFNTNLYFFENRGKSDSSDLRWSTQDYLTNITYGFNHPAFADLDNDNDLDMVIGVTNGGEIDNLYYYRNDGTNLSALLLEQSKNFIATIDHGASSVPAVGDLDGDYDLDLLVGSSNGQLAFYWNNGDIHNPTFELITANYKAIDVGSNSAPELVDYDGDGDLDLLIGNRVGFIWYYQNDGDKNNFVPTLISNQFAGIKVDQLALPRTFDWNGDLRPDLVVGEWDFNSKANLRLYEHLLNDSLQEITASLLPNQAGEYRVPTIYDYNKDGSADLIIGSNLLGLNYFKNQTIGFTFPDSTTIIPQSDSLHGSDDGRQLAMVYADFDYDGDDDLLIGEENGGLNYYENIGGCCFGLKGNVNNSPDQLIDIDDVVFLVDYMFIRAGNRPPACFEETDLNGDIQLDIEDLVYLIDYSFRGGPPPPACEN